MDVWGAQGIIGFDELTIVGWLSMLPPGKGWTRLGPVTSTTMRPLTEEETKTFIEKISK